MDKRQMQIIRVLRVTPELKGILDAAAARFGIPICEVLRRVAAGIRSGRPCRYVADDEKMKSATKSGEIVVNIESGIAVPDMCNGYNLRRAIYLRVMEELARPERPRSNVPDAVEGIDYNVPDAVAAAKLMEA